MSAAAEPPDQVATLSEKATRSAVRYSWVGGGFLLAITAIAAVAAEPALAQSAGDAFCSSELAETVRNLFTIIQFGGPLIGGVLALGATVAIPMSRRVDVKKELKEVRNQGIIWGVIVAPLGTVILQFILNNVVAGGASCGF